MMPRSCTGEPITPSPVGEDVDRLKALAHPVRLGIVSLLASNGGDLCACEIQARFDVSQPTISHHLRLLREAELIRSTQVGTWVHYDLAPGALEDLGRRLATLGAGNVTRATRRSVPT